MSGPTPSFTVNVDVTNPGQFFACCGLLELAHRLWPGTEGWFDTTEGNFRLRVPDKNASLFSLMGQIASCALEGLTQDERDELENLERRQRELRKLGQNLSDTEEQRRKELGKQAREGQLLVKGMEFQITLNWWQDEGTPATWAGRQEVHTIAIAAQNSIANFLKENQDLKNILNWQQILRRPREHRAGEGSEKKVEPFYFDARRFAHALDVGFSLDVQKAESEAYPAVEFLCLVGLQRFRPRQARDSKWSFEYWTWSDPLPSTVAAGVVCGSVQIPGREKYRFSLQFRDDEGRYKAFGIATLVGD